MQSQKFIINWMKRNVYKSRSYKSFLNWVIDHFDIPEEETWIYEESQSIWDARKFKQLTNRYSE